MTNRSNVINRCEVQDVFDRRLGRVQLWRFKERHPLRHLRFIQLVIAAQVELVVFADHSISFEGFQAIEKGASLGFSRMSSRAVPTAGPLR
jgi:hypothetical protein